MADSDVIIPNKTYFKIGEVARLTELEPHVLRYWETEFKQLRPEKSTSGQRLYRREHVERVLEVKDLLYRQKFTIAGARRRLLHRHDQDAAEAAEQQVRKQHKAAMRDHEETLRSTLLEIRGQLVDIRRKINLGN